MTHSSTPENSSEMRIACVVGHGYRSVECIEVLLPVGSVAFDALRVAFMQGLTLHVQDQVLDAQSLDPVERCHERLQNLLTQSQLFLSNWGEPCGLDQELTPSTRLEISKALRVDPKVARRERFKKQGAKAAGLFAKQRAGAKAGY
jgi:hypothetical protein